MNPGTTDMLTQAWSLTFSSAPKSAKGMKASLAICWIQWDTLYRLRQQSTLAVFLASLGQPTLHLGSASGLSDSLTTPNSEDILGQDTPIANDGHRNLSGADQHAEEGTFSTSDVDKSG